jgi:hypothetical protein
MITQSQQAFADGFIAGQSATSGSNAWTFSKHLDDYVRGFEAGGQTYLGKLRLGRLSELDCQVIDWQREHMDVMEVIDGTGEFRNPTDEDAARVLDEIRAEAEAMTC